MKTRLIIFGINRNIRISLAVSLVPLTLLSLFFQSEGIPQISDGESENVREHIYGVYVGELAFIEPVSESRPYVYPFTPHGRQEYEKYDPDFDDPRQSDDCALEAMPAHLLTEAVAKMEFLADEGGILMRLERDDAVRTIHMQSKPAPANQQSSLLGYSRGFWEGTALVIETTHLLNGVIFAQRAFPMSGEAHILERYQRNTETKDLQMELVVYDPINYTKPITMQRKWVWRPDEQIYPWECVHLGSRDEPLDLDALRRQLEQR